MAVTFLPRNNDALARAFAALRTEEAEVIKDMAELQARFEALRTAMASMKSLMPSEQAASSEQRILKLSDAQPGRFAGMQFSKALKSFMDTQRDPLTPREATIKFEEAGWNFTAETFNNKLNQVGVSFRRYEGVQFKRTPDNKWMSIGSYSDLA